MPRFDLPLSDLRDYRPEVRVPADFDDFWLTTIAGAREAGGAPVVTPVTTPLRGIEAFDVTFPGFAGDPVKGWLMGMLGLFVAQIGQEGLYAYDRFTFGWDELSGGIAQLLRRRSAAAAVLIGLLAAALALRGGRLRTLP